MNVKALAAIVGTLSLGALATGCASNKAAEGSTGATESTATPGEAKCNAEKPADGAAAPTQEKAGEGKCGAGSCSGNK
jgi:uncharacterized low-complexity protein